MVLELILGLSLFHHKKKIVTPKPKEDPRITASIDLVATNDNALHNIETKSHLLNFEPEEIKKAEDLAVTCHTDTDPEKFIADAKAYDAAVDELIVKDEMFQGDDAI